jgi:hypothetical protein
MLRRSLPLHVWHSSKTRQRHRSLNTNLRLIVGLLQRLAMCYGASLEPMPDGYLTDRDQPRPPGKQNLDIVV